jgi:hypothetical protein
VYWHPLNAYIPKRVPEKKIYAKFNLFSSQIEVAFLIFILYYIYFFLKEKI